MDKITEIINRGVENVFPSKEELEKVLRSEKKIRLYQGFDPSMPSLHLGNLVGLMKLRQFQKLGHEVIFLVGDFTGMIGDPTDKLATRKQLTRDEVLKNADSWKEQAGKVLEFDGPNAAKIMFNSTWNDKTTFRDLIEITSNFTVQQMLGRDMFQERVKEEKPIHLHEFLYPVAQALDSVAMDVDLEIGGHDQVFNMLCGRSLMKALKNKEKYVLTTKLLVDANGQKIGKTTGNALFLNSSPDDFYGGILSFPDEVIFLGFELLTEEPLEGLEEIIKEKPFEEKKHLAFEIVTLLWGQDTAEKAQKHFEDQFQNNLVPENIITINLSDTVTISEALMSSGATTSKAEAKRLIDMGAVDLDGTAVKSHHEPVFNDKQETILKVGKRQIFKLKRS